MSRPAILHINKVQPGDCIELMRQLPESCAQLIIADPPYNLGPTFGIAREWQHDDAWLNWCRVWLAECKRILSEDGNIFVFGIHHYMCYVQVALYDLGLAYRRQIIWHYENGFSNYRKSLATHYEPILWFSKGEKYYFHEIREPYKSVDRLRYSINKNGKVWTPNPKGRLAGDVWRFPTLAGRRFQSERVNHPTQKPLALTDRIVEHFSVAGALVVVPFAGSGTECVSAMRQGRDFWASEIKDEYVQLATERLERERSIQCQRRSSSLP